MCLEETENGRSILQICGHTTSRCSSGHTHAHYAETHAHMNYVDILIMEFWVYIFIFMSLHFSEMYEDHTAELTS